MKLKSGRPRTPHEQTEPIIREINEAIELSGESFHTIAERAGVSDTFVQNMRKRRHYISFTLFRCVVEAMGYEIRLVHRGE